MARRSEAIGTILAGGSGLRMGGSKATVELRGRPLISYPLEAVWRALGHVVVLAKADTELPSLPGVTIWIEPAGPSHPLFGLVHALELAEGRPVFVCAVDLPFVTPRLVRRLASGMRGADAVLAGSEGEAQPLLGWYHHRALGVLREIDPADGISVREAVARLRPVVVEVGDPELLFNVNSPADLLQATAMLDARARAAAGDP
jgi:molybdopterin-guanine dinucleotide biosynthesis protein A